MYHHSFNLISAKPEQIHVYDTIINPFDNYIWCFTFMCIGLQFVLLCIMQHLWCQLSGEIRDTDFVYEGFNKKVEILSIAQLIMLFFQISFSQPSSFPKRD